MSVSPFASRDGDVSMETVEGTVERDTLEVAREDCDCARPDRVLRRESDRREGTRGAAR